MTKTKYAVDAATRRIRFKRKLKLNLWCWMFMSLAVGFYILFQGYPIICSIQYSLLDWSGMTSNATFIGLQNYKELMHDELFWNAFINSFKYMVMIVPLELAVSLFLAYLLNDEKMKGRGLYRTMYFVPVVTTASVVGIIMIFILGVQGPVNHLLVTLHILKNPINFLGNAKDVQPSLGAIVQGIISQSITDYDSALKTLANDTTTEWKRASEAVGMDYSSLEFPNWDATKDYTDADYETLK